MAGSTALAGQCSQLVLLPLPSLRFPRTAHRQASQQHFSSPAQAGRASQQPLGPTCLEAKSECSSSSGQSATCQPDARSGEARQSLSRREALELFTAATAGVCLPILPAVQPAEAAEDAPLITTKVYFDVAVDRKPVGRIVIGLYGNDVPTGAARFADLVKGYQGIGYRRKAFELITPTYIRNAGVRSFNPGDNPANPALITGGTTNERVVEEMATTKGRFKHSPGIVSILAVDSKQEGATTKLRAEAGKLVMVEEKGRPAPNASQFDIATADAPELEQTNLIVGRVVEGMEVIRELAALPVNKDNSSSGYFQVGKMIGDKRALVAERGFNRPFAKIIITDCGVLADE